MSKYRVIEMDYGTDYGATKKKVYFSKFISMKNVLLIKAIGGRGKPCFYNLILFYRVFTKLQVAFYRFKKIKLFLRYDQSKSRRITGS